MKKVVICLLSTGKYEVFLKPLIDSIEKYFLLDHKIEIHIFWDRPVSYPPWTHKRRMEFYTHTIPSLKFPEITLRRFEIMTSIDYNCDYLYYMDVDMLVVREVGEEIFGDLVAVGHPGYSIVGGGAWCDDMNSLAYTLRTKRSVYVAGGFQGGNKKYIEAMKQMAENIQKDSHRGVMAPWHDESHWNKYFSENREKFKLLHSGYCMVENQVQRQLWRIDKLTPYILCLDKNHSELRS